MRYFDAKLDLTQMEFWLTQKPMEHLEGLSMERIIHADSPELFDPVLGAVDQGATIQFIRLKKVSVFCIQN